MSSITVYKMGEGFKYVGSLELEEHPIHKGAYDVPSDCFFDGPPKIKQGQEIYRSDDLSEWILK